MLGALCLVLGAMACDRGPRAAPAAGSATGSAPAAPAAPAASATGTTFGAGVKLTAATPIDAILSDPKSYSGKTVRVEGMITDVCPKRGCWLELAGAAPGKKLRFKVNDGEMVFPVDAKGRIAVAEGVVAVRDLTLEESKQYAEYQAKEYNLPYDPASVTAPLSVVSLDGTGAVLR